MAQVTPFPHPRTGRTVAALVAFAAAAAAVAGLLAVLGFHGATPVPSRDAPLAGSAAPSMPPGVITFEVTGQGLFTAVASGSPLGTTTYEQLHAEGHVAAPVETAPSPDGRYLASVLREPAGVFLALTGPDGAQQPVVQLAAGDDPALVAGGKGHARAVAGVPLVVAWSPDSTQLAFGSITGEPYSLGILRHPGLKLPEVSYREVTGGYVGELAWSPDGRWLAISTYSMDRRDHSVLVVDAALGGYARYLIDGCHVTWSPDSRYVAIHRDPGPEAGAWVVSVTDPADRWPISREPGAFPLTWR